MGAGTHRLFNSLVVMGAMLGAGGCDAFAARYGPEGSGGPADGAGARSGAGGAIRNAGGGGAASVAVPYGGGGTSTGYRTPDAGGDADAGLACDPILCNCGGAGDPRCAGCEVFFCAIT